jgi:hypothetical protein
MSNSHFDPSLKLFQGEAHDFSGEVQKFSGDVQNDLRGCAHLPSKSGHDSICYQLVFYIVYSVFTLQMVYLFILYIHNGIFIVNSMSSTYHSDNTRFTANQNF